MENECVDVICLIQESFRNRTKEPENNAWTWKSCVIARSESYANQLEGPILKQKLRRHRARFGFRRKKFLKVLTGCLNPSRARLASRKRLQKVPFWTRTFGHVEGPSLHFSDFQKSVRFSNFIQTTIFFTTSWSTLASKLINVSGLKFLEFIYRFNHSHSNQRLVSICCLHASIHCCFVSNMLSHSPQPP